MIATGSHHTDGPSDDAGPGGPLGSCHTGPVTRLPHPRTGRLFESPVPPGTGWPGDPARPTTPIAHDAEEVLALAADCRDLAELDARVSVCRACPRLVEWRERAATDKRAAWRREPYWGRPLPSLGPDDAAVLVVGLAPAAHGGNRTGRMFTGDRSGDWLHAALHRSGLANQPTSVDAGDGLELIGTRIVAPVHCAPPDNRPTTQERHTCSGWFEAELHRLVTVRSVVALGHLAWGATLTAARHLGWQVPRPAPRFGHGAKSRLLRCDDQAVTLLGCYHVSQQNTFTGRLTEEMLDDVIGRAARLAGLPTAADQPADPAPRRR